jgi:hypothetical protein
VSVRGLLTLRARVRLRPGVRLRGGPSLRAPVRLRAGYGCVEAFLARRGAAAPGVRLRGGLVRASGSSVSPFPPPPGEPLRRGGGGEGRDSSFIKTRRPPGWNRRAPSGGRLRAGSRRRRSDGPIPCPGTGAARSAHETRDRETWHGERSWPCRAGPLGRCTPQRDPPCVNLCLRSRQAVPWHRAHHGGERGCTAREAPLARVETVRWTVTRRSGSSVRACVSTSEVPRHGGADEDGQ